MKKISKNTKEDYSKMKVNVPTAKNTLLEKILERVNSDEEVKILWRIINVNAIDRYGITDHGYVHFQIVANIALRLMRILNKNGVKMSVVRDFKLSYEHAEVVVFLTSLFHDLGITINRKKHEEVGLFLADKIINKILDFLPAEERIIISSEVLHAIYNHGVYGSPKTIEAGIIRVADALDMSKGRSRIPYEAGRFDIHSISAAAVDHVEIREGKDKPIRIKILMNNSSGIFQVDELLKRKLIGSGIEKYVEIKAHVSGKKEKKLIQDLVIKG